MPKGKFVQSLIDLAEKSGLDMSDAARMQRARDIGFDTEKTYYHGTNQDFEEFDPSKFKGRSTTRIGSEINVNKYPAFAENERVSEFFANKARTPPGVLYPGAKIIKTKIKMENPLIVDMKDVPKNKILESQKSYDSDNILHDIALIKEESLRKAIDGGYDGVVFKNGYDFRPYDGDIVFPLKKENIRSVDAAFDPAKKDSGNLLAGALPIGAIGLAGALSPNESYAQAARVPISALNFPENNDVGSIVAPKNQLAAELSGYSDQYNKARQQRLAPPANMLLPVGELPSEYLNKVAYGDKITFKDRLKAALGLL